jgi:hypothetical protein
MATTKSDFEIYQLHVWIRHQQVELKAAWGFLAPGLPRSPRRTRKMLGKAVKELRGYIGSNEAFIPNYGERYRHDETISTAFVESTVNQVISKRFVKKQQIKWTPDLRQKFKMSSNPGNPKS